MMICGEQVCVRSAISMVSLEADVTIASYTTIWENHISSRNPSWQNCQLYLLNRQLFEEESSEHLKKVSQCFIQKLEAPKMGLYISKSSESIMWHRRSYYYYLYYSYSYSFVQVFQDTHTKKLCQTVRVLLNKNEYQY